MLEYTISDLRHWIEGMIPAWVLLILVLFTVVMSVYYQAKISRMGRR